MKERGPKKRRARTEKDALPCMLRLETRVGAGSSHEPPREGLTIFIQSEVPQIGVGVMKVSWSQIAEIALSLDVADEAAPLLYENL